MIYVKTWKNLKKHRKWGYVENGKKPIGFAFSRVLRVPRFYPFLTVFYRIVDEKKGKNMLL